MKLYILNLKKRTIHDSQRLKPTCQITPGAMRRSRVVTLGEYRKLSEGNFARYYPCGNCLPDGFPGGN